MKAEQERARTACKFLKGPGRAIAEQVGQIPGLMDGRISIPEIGMPEQAVAVVIDGSVPVAPEMLVAAL